MKKILPIIVTLGIFGFNSCIMDKKEKVQNLELYKKVEDVIRSEVNKRFDSISAKDTALILADSLRNDSIREKLEIEQKEPENATP